MSRAAPICPLAILLARGRITREMYDAGKRFATDAVRRPTLLARLDALPAGAVARAVLLNLAVHRRRDWYVADVERRRRAGGSHRRRTALIRTALQALAAGGVAP